MEGNRPKDHGETKIKKQEAFLRDSFKASVCAQALTDNDGILTDVNAAFFRMWGYADKSGVLGRRLGDFIRTESRRASIMSSLEKEGVWEGEFDDFRLDGTAFSGFGSAASVHDDEGKRVGFHASFIDITDKKRAEEEQKESEERFTALFDGAPDAIFIADTQKGEILDANKAACRLLGRTRDQVIGMTQQDLYPSASRERSREVFYLHVGQSQSYGHSDLTEMTVIRKDGTEVPVEIHAQIIRLHRESVLMGTFRDISDRKKAEDELRRKQEFISNINNNLVSGMVYQVLRLKDGSRRFTYLSDSVRRMYGVTAKKAMKNPELIYSRVFDGDREKVRMLEEEANRGLSVFRTEVRLKNPDGSTRWSSFVSNPTLLPDGSTQWDGIELDITDRKRAEEKLKESELKAKAMLGAIPDMMFRLDRSGTFLDYKAERGDLYYRGKTTFIGRRLDEILPREMVDLTAGYIAKALETGDLQTYSYELPIPEKGIRKYEARMVRSGENEVTAIVRDITGRKTGGVPKKKKKKAAASPKKTFK